MANIQINITTNGTTTLATAGKYCDRNIDINVAAGGSGGIIPTGTLNITENGTYNVTNYASAEVNVAGSSGGSAYWDEATVKAYLENTLTSVTLPSNLTKIMPYAFYESNITTINIPNTVTSIGQNAFYHSQLQGTVVIPDSVVEMGKYAFSYAFMTEVQLPNNPQFTTISDHLFYNCPLLKTINIPSNVTTIGQHAFNSCNALTSLTFPASVQSIDYNAFAWCELETITFKGTPSNLSAGAFNYCDKITTINVPWAEGAVAGAPWGATNATINYNYTA